MMRTLVPKGCPNVRMDSFGGLLRRIPTITLGVIGLMGIVSSMAWGQARLSPQDFGGQAKPSIEERMIRLEEGMKNLEKRIDGLEINMNKRIDGIEKRIDDLKTDLKGFMYWGFGVLFSGMFLLVGFILWDRRTALAPVARETKYIQAELDELRRRQKTLIEVVNKYAEHNPKLKGLMNKAALF